MATKFKNGDVVQQVQPAPIKGTVSRFTFDETSGSVGYIVKWTDADGVEHERHFNEDQIQAAE